jgi:membrane-bound inhibitor of C-type lysozyme
MKGFIASSICVVTAGMAAFAIPAFAQQTTQHTQTTKTQTTKTQQTTQAQPTSQAKVITQAVYKCDDGKSFSAVYRDDSTAETTFGSKVLTLNQIESGSGARYSNGSVTLYIKGDTAFVEVGNNKLFTNCVATGGGVHGMW